MPTATTAKEEDDDDALICPLCTETMIVSQKKDDGVNLLRRIIRQCHSQLSLLLAIQRHDCCQQYVCQSCLYRHVHSILEEGIAGVGSFGGTGRTTLTCPLGCGREMTDTDVRTCFHGQHVHVFWNLFFGPLIMYPLCLLCIMLFPFCFWNNENGGGEDDDYFVLRHKCWIFCYSTRAEQNDLCQYERWSLAVALRNIQRQEQLPNAVMHCPSPNCDYVWLVANPSYRESKVAHERRKVYLWYTPPKPEQAHSSCTIRSSNKTKKDNDSNFDDWCRPEFLNMSRAFTGNGNRTNTPGATMDWLAATEQTTDGRYMCCAKCHVLFCGLCRQPWRFGSKCHVGISCQAYQRQLPTAIQENGAGGNHRDAFVFFATTSSSNGNYNDEGRCCPGCSMFTSRTGGCNHMTCPCGVEWCYVCEQRWNSLHYGCVDRPAGYYNGTATTLGCIIS
jgi:hypothetical protein